MTTVHSDAIPTGVYYSAEHDNFYSFARQGMGNLFFKEWRSRWKEFPSQPPVKGAAK